MGKKIRIFYTAVVDRNGTSLTIGGIQTYLMTLCQVLTQAGYNPIIYQAANKDFRRTYSKIQIIGIKTDAQASGKNQIKRIFEKSKKDFDLGDILIWGSDKIAIKTNFEKSIAIQHGISFDYIPYQDIGGIWQYNVLGFLYKRLQTSKAAKEFLTTKNVVCVDYNYLNWIRTFLPRKFSENVTVIPNFAEISTQANVIHKDLSTIRILFARRFEAMRGVDIMIEIVKEILTKYNNVEFTISGEGSLEHKIVNELGGYSQVKITKFKIGEANAINLSHHITIIPTYGSEGTSLSLLEGMAAGAVPVASNVGGLTNTIIDGFNGFLVNPTTLDFVGKLSFLIENPKKLIAISKTSKDSLEAGFSFEKWSSKWLETINNMSHK